MSREGKSQTGPSEGKEECHSLMNFLSKLRLWTIKHSWDRRSSEDEYDLRLGCSSVVYDGILRNGPDGSLQVHCPLLTSLSSFSGI